MLGDQGIKVAGICGMFSDENELSSNRAIQRQAALYYIKRELEFGAASGAKYMLVVPGSCGRPVAYDNTELERSVEALRLVADLFVNIPALDHLVHPEISWEDFNYFVKRLKEMIGVR